jgi:uncharacterized delta-60 repeat protein
MALSISRVLAGRAIRVLPLLIALPLAAVTAASQTPRAPGDLDGSFGSGGVAQTAFPLTAPAEGYAVVAQPTGQYVVAGVAYGAITADDFSLTRYNADGSVDGSFGAGGHTTTDFRHGADTPFALASQPDGKLVAVGTADSGGATVGALARYLPDGALDPLFGVGGKLTIDLSNGFLRAVSIQPDGKIAVAGNDGADFLLLRYLPNGALDPDFGDNGRVLTDFGGAYDWATALALMSDGRIVAAGGTNGDFAIARYLANGALDISFDGDGKTTVDFGTGFDSGNAVSINALGALVVAGSAGPGNAASFALARLRVDGSLDPGFGAGGRVTTSFGTPVSQANDAYMDGGGGVLAAGMAAADCSSGACSADFAVARYQSNGSLDLGFGYGGKITTNFGQDSYSLIHRLLRESNGGFLAVGATRPDRGAYQTALVRYGPGGGLDTSFGVGGIVTTGGLTSSVRAHAVTLLADGRIVTAGSGAAGCYAACSGHEFTLTRHTAAGALDPSFGAGGRVITAFPGGASEAYGLVVQPDGKVVAAGYAAVDTSDAFALARYLPDGSLDPSFGSGGLVTTDIDFTFRDAAFTLALQPDGKLVAGGYAYGAGFTLVRYLSNGNPDPSFGYQGIVRTRIDSGEAYAFALALQPDGKILAGGATAPACSQSCPNENFALARYLPNGDLDPAFGAQGVVTTSLALASDDRIYGLALQPDGKIVAGGPAGVNCDNNCQSSDFGLARYLPDGQLDPSFGSSGKLTTDLSGWDSLAGLALQPDGRIVTAGVATMAEQGVFAVARYLSDGALDTSFGAGGKALGASAGEANAVVLQPDSRILVAGEGHVGGGANVALARYMSNNDPAPTPLMTATATASVTAIPTPGACGQFSDVRPTDYFYTPVQYLVGRGVISGYGDCTFRPYNNTTRGQMVKIVTLGFSRPIVTPTAGGYTFADVPANSPFYGYIETAAAGGVVSGYACGGPGEPCDGARRPYFRPNANVTRGQLSKITTGAAGWALRNPARGSFSDVAPGSAFYTFVETAYCHGIISGYNCGAPGEPCDPQARPYFRQANNATRGQIAKIVYGATTNPGSCAP